MIIADQDVPNVETWTPGAGHLPLYASEHEEHPNEYAGKDGARTSHPCPVVPRGVVPKGGIRADVPSKYEKVYAPGEHIIIASHRDGCEQLLLKMVEAVLPSDGYAYVTHRGSDWEHAFREAGGQFYGIVSIVGSRQPLHTIKQGDDR